MFDIEGKMICLPIFDTNFVYERWGGEGERCKKNRMENGGEGFG